jgi:hypothetical protein
MNTLTHRFGLELDLTSFEAQQPDYKNAIETKILRKEGIYHAEFSKEHTDIVIIEFDPSITTPDAIYKTVKRQNVDIKRKVFL